MLLRKVFAFILCFCACEAYSQPIIPRFETIGVNEGLSQSSVYSIYQDSLGFMWFGTADGLNRYDGETNKIFKVQDNISSKGNSNYIRGKLCEDEKGNIWYSNETGIYYFDRLKETINLARPFEAEQFNNIIFTSLGIDKKQQLWMISIDYGIACYDLKSGRFTIFPYPADFSKAYRYNTASSMDEKGNIWFSFYENKGIYKFDPVTRKFNQLFKNRDIRQVFFGKGKTYFIAPNCIYTYDSLTNTLAPLPGLINKKKTKNFNAVFEDPYERLWILTLGDGLIYYNKLQKKFHVFTHDNAKLKSLPIDMLTEAFVDRTNNLWIGTDGGGVCRLDLKPPRFNVFPLNEGDYPFLKDYFTKCFYEDEQKRIWFGTHSNGFNIFNPSTGAVTNYSNRPGDPQSLPGNIVGSIFKDKEGHLWIGHCMGFSIFNEKENSFSTIKITPSKALNPWSIYVNNMTQLSNGNILASTKSGLVLIKKKGKGFVAKDYKGGPANTQCTDAVEVRPNSVWFTCPIIGLLHVRLEKDSFLMQEKFFPGIDLRCVYQDQQEPHLIWVGSSKGLIKFNTLSKEFKVYTEAHGMSNNYVYGILEDEKHNLWLSTNGGLIYFDKSNNTFQNYKINDGLQSNEFNTGAYYKSPSGNFYFGGIKGFNWFRNIKKTGSFKPVVAITDIFLQERAFQKDQVFFATKTITLPYNQNNLSFHFAALDFTRPQANKIQYQLAGWDPQWFTTYSKSVRYPNLLPGHYILKVKACNPDGIWSDEEYINIIIHPPFWKHWWFYTIVTLTGIVSIVLITKNLSQRKLRQQLQELEKQRAIEAERNRISKDMHDEIGSGLTHIALMSELIQTQQKAGPELKKDVSTISSSARKLVQSMSEIIWTLNPQNDTLENLLAYLREQTLNYFEPFAVDYVIHFPDEVPAIKLTNEQRRNIFLVAKEALHNALKHAAATSITLSMNMDEQLLHFYVIDNGRGFDLSRPKVSANGLRNMQRRMKDIGGFFDISSNTDGTEVHFYIPGKRLQRSRTTFFTSPQKH